MPADPRAEALAALSSFLIADRSMGDTLTEISRIAVDAIGPAQMAGISMQDGAGPATRVYTDAETVTIDDAQYESGRGPCLDAWRHGEVVLIDRIDDASGYPEFAARATDHGIHSSMSLPLTAGRRSLGALNLYARAARSFTAEHRTVGIDIASAAAVVLVNAAAYHGAFELTQQLEEAIESRAMIEQAKGILMAGRPGTTPDEAFNMLVGASQRQNVKLRAIAQQIVDRASRPGPPA